MNKQTEKRKKKEKISGGKIPEIKMKKKKKKEKEANRNEKIIMNHEKL